MLPVALNPVQRGLFPHSYALRGNAALDALRRLWYWEINGNIKSVSISRS